MAVGNVDAHVTAPAARAIDAGQMLMVMGTSTCHIMNGDELAEVPGMCGVVDGGVVPGPVGLRGGPERRRRHLRLVRRPGGAAGLPRGGAPPRGRPAHAPVRAGRRAARRRARAGRARLAQRQPLDPRRPRAERADRRAHAGDAAGARLPRAAGGDGVRHAQDHRGVRGRRRAGARADRRRRADQEPGA